VLLTISAFFNTYPDYVADVSITTGVVLGSAFDDKFEGLSTSSTVQEDFKRMLQADTADIEDPFAAYDTGRTAKAYIAAYGMEGDIADALREKYAAFQTAFDRAAASGERMTLYFAGATVTQHQELFGGLMRSLLMEGILIAALVALLSAGYEHMSRTELCVYASKTGRRVLRPKLMASLTVGVVMYLLLTALSLILYLAAARYGNVWGSGVSSLYNVILDLVTGVRPYVTWQGFTVFTYLLAVIGISAGIVASLTFLSFAIGAAARNGYLGFFTFVFINLMCIAAVMCLPMSSYAPFLLNLSPIALWWSQLFWFTDGGGGVLWKNYETLGMCASLAVTLALCLASVSLFKRRDIL
jgi:hypothetical protein